MPRGSEPWWTAPARRSILDRYMCSKRIGTSSREGACFHTPTAHPPSCLLVLLPDPVSAGPAKLCGSPRGAGPDHPALAALLIANSDSLLTPLLILYLQQMSRLTLVRHL